MVLGVVACAGVAPAAAQEPKWSAWSEFGGAYKTDNASRGGVTLFVPVMQGPRDLLFVDARGKLFEDSAKEGNLALAYRQMLKSGWNVGAWVGGDVRGTALDNTFWQLSGGLEALSENFDLRLNGYGPISAPQAAGPNSDFTQVVLSGSSIYMVGGREVGLRGVDGEVGVRLPSSLLSLDPEKFELRAYGGAFYFDHEAALKQGAGPKARLELRVNDILPGMPGSRLTAEYGYSYDEVRDHRHEIGARLRIPLGQPDTWTRYAGLNAQERRMMDGLERDVDIVVVQSEAEPVEDALTNVDFDRVAYVDDGGSVTSTANSAGGNSLIISKGGTITGEQFLQDSQTLQSGASTIQVRGLSSGTVANFTAPFSHTTLTSADTNVVNLVSNTHLNGFTITKTGTSQDDAVVARDALDNEGFENFAITNNTISTEGDGSNAVGIDNRNDTVWVIGNTLTTTGEEAQGIEFGNRNSNVALLNNTITTEEDDSFGIEVGSRNSNFTVAGNTITTLEDSAYGIYFDRRNNNILVADNSILTHEYQSSGIVFNRRNTNVTLTGNTVTTQDDDADGIVFVARNRNVTLSGNTVTTQDGDADGIVFVRRNRFITLTGNTITTQDDGAFGVVFDERNRDITVSGNTINTNGESADGLYFGYRNNRISVANNTIATQGFDSFGIDFDEDNRNATVTGNTVTTQGPIAPAVYLGIANSGITIFGNDIATNGFFSNGVRLDVLNDDVTISGNTVTTTNDESDAVLIGFANAASVLSNTLTTSGSGADAIQIGEDNVVTITGNNAVGSIGDDYLDVISDGNVLDGAGNTIAAGTTIGDKVCESSGGAGSVEIAGITYVTDDLTSCPP